MLHILDWPPLVWTLRVGLLIVLGASVLLFVLLVARYFRWSNVRRMVMADLPRIKSVGGEFAGTKGEGQFHDQQATQLAALERKLKTLERLIAPIVPGGGMDDDEAGA